MQEYVEEGDQVSNPISEFNVHHPPFKTHLPTYTTQKVSGFLNLQQKSTCLLDFPFESMLGLLNLSSLSTLPFKSWEVF